MFFVDAPHTGVETPTYLGDAKRTALPAADLLWIVQSVAAAPAAGDVVRESGGVRKIRVAGRGKGKSGGYRIIVAYVGPEAPAYIPALLSNGDRGNFTKQAIGQMKAFTMAIKRNANARKTSSRP